MNHQSTTRDVNEANDGHSQQISSRNSNSSDGISNRKPAIAAAASAVAVTGDGERKSGEKGGVRRQGGRRRSVSFCFVLKVYLIPRVSDFRERYVRTSNLLNVYNIYYLD